MVVLCPKCKTKLKIDDARISPEGSRFKCPKCATVLLVKRPAEKPASPLKKALLRNRVLVAHSNPEVRSRITTILSGEGLEVITTDNGIDAVVKSLKELPRVCIVEVALPKIYGFEVCKRLKSRPETKDMKFILIPSIYDRNKYRREPVSLYDADEYIEEDDLSSQLMEKVNRFMGLGGEEKTAPAAGRVEPVSQAVAQPGAVQPEQTMRPQAPAQPNTGKPAEPSGSQVAERPSDDKVEKAKRLARTIINDINLYNTAKMDEAIRTDSVYSAFAMEIREGQKLYESRIPQEVRNINDFFKEAIDNFISNKKKSVA